MSLRDFVDGVERFDAISGVEQVLLIAWYIQSKGSKPTFDNAAVRLAFKQAGRVPPDITVYLPRMAGKKPPLLIKDKAGYSLAGDIRRKLDQKYGGQPSIIAITDILSSLPNQVPSLIEREFLTEALNCYRVKAYRSSIVMTWNLAYDHLRRWILTDTNKLQVFNVTVREKYPRKQLTINSLDDFDELKESELIEVCRTSSLLSKNVVEILREKLRRRNASAHPSSVVITQHQADDAISDLVNNVVLTLL